MDEDRNSLEETPEQPAAPQPPEIEAGTGVIMATLGRDLTARGAEDAKAYLPRQVKPKHERTTPVGTLRVVSFKVFGRFSTYSASYNARGGEQSSMMLGAFIKGAGDEMTREEAIGIATKTVNPPPRAILETAEYDQAAGEPFFVVRWAHVHQGAVVERDFVQAMINGQTRRIFSWQRKWHQISEEATER